MVVTSFCKRDGSFLISREHFITIPGCGATRMTLTFQEGGLGLTTMRPNYRPIGVHRSLRSVSL